MRRAPRRKGRRRRTEPLCSESVVVLARICDDRSDWHPNRNHQSRCLHRSRCCGIPRRPWSDPAKWPPARRTPSVQGVQPPIETPEFRIMLLLLSVKIKNNAPLISITTIYNTNVIIVGESDTLLCWEIVFLWFKKIEQNKISNVKPISLFGIK